MVYSVVGNKKCHLLFQLAKEAIEVEEKEEKLVSEAVKHLSDANVRISHLSEEFTSKVDESRKQKEEITHLLAKVRPIHSFRFVLHAFIFNTCQSKSSKRVRMMEPIHSFIRDDRQSLPLHFYNPFFLWRSPLIKRCEQIIVTFPLSFGSLVDHKTVSFSPAILAFETN